MERVRMLVISGNCIEVYPIGKEVKRVCYPEISYADIDNRAKISVSELHRGKPEVTIEFKEPVYCTVARNTLECRPL